MPRRDTTASPFLFSLLLHALVAVLVVTGLAEPSSAARDEKLAALFPAPETVDVELVDPADAPKILVDASGAPELAPEEPTNLVSERDSRAADQGPRDLPEDAPYNEGETSLPNPTPGEGGREAPPPAPAEAPRPPAATAAAPERPASPEPADPALAEAEAPTTDEEAGEREGPGNETAPGGELASAGGKARSTREREEANPLGDSRLSLPQPDLTLPPVAPPGTAGAAGRRGMPQVDNRLSRARVEGEFALSTYAWDYAPYMARLKREIEDYTWTILPSAFWYGIAAWATQVRFTILPDGRLESITITGHDGVLELRHVAPDAVKGAAEFEPLPPGFPDPKLTIVGNFYFNEFPPARTSAAPGKGSSGGTEADRSSTARGDS